ncbi:MAG: hypothetical protein H7Y41_03480 [Hyphomonadaceae bacterium]|nr:hypothetical protein [Clostridia bacterium]
MRKVFVDVTAVFSKEGILVPISFVWEDGERYEVDKILDCRNAASLKAGGCGVRYTCRVCGKETFLFLEDNRWFMEGK